MFDPKFIPLVAEAGHPPPHAHAADRRRRRDGDVPVLRRAGDAGGRERGDARRPPRTRRSSSTARTASAPRPAGCRSITRDRIAKVPGVASVVPMKIVVTNCRTSLDVVTFRGVPAEAFVEHVRADADVRRRLDRRSGTRRTDAALLGETLANRRGLRSATGSTRPASTSYVAGIVRSDEPQDQNVGVRPPAVPPAVERRPSKLGRRHAVQREGRRPDAARAGRRRDRRRVRPRPRADADERREGVRRPRRGRRRARSSASPSGSAGGAWRRCWRWSATRSCCRVQDRIREHAVLQTLGYRGGADRAADRRREARCSACSAARSGRVAAAALLRWEQLQPLDRRA